MRLGINYKQVEAADYEAIRQFLSGVGWQHRVADSAKFTQMMENTNRAVIATENDRIIGFARALCDGVSNGYISMVAVTPDKRGQGIGREMVNQLMGDQSGEAITWMLRAGRESKLFWEKLGFNSSTLAMEKPRK